MIMVTYAYMYTNAWTCAKIDQRTWCWRLLLMPCFIQMLNLSAMLVPCVICPHPSSPSMIDPHPMTLAWSRPMRLKITFPTLTPMHDRSHVFCVSNLSYPEECQLKLEAMCLPSLHGLCAINSICWNAKPSNKCKLSLDTSKKGYKVKLWKV